MKIGRYRFKCRLLDQAQLPAFKGSMFRGVLGLALKRVTCTLRHLECGKCLLNKSCVYAAFFESDLQQTVDQPAPSPPKPYMLEFPMTPKENFEAGEGFEFDLILFGGFNDALPYLVYAVKHMGETGIGRKVEGRRARYILETVANDGRVIYQENDDQLQPASSIELTIESLDATAPDHAFLTVHLETPLRLKFQNTLTAALPFHLLVRAALRRYVTLETSFGAGRPDLDFGALVAAAEQVSIARNRLHWIELQRYSSRQDRQMLMGGMAGQVTYTGNFRGFLPLLKYAQMVHLGKQTTFGLGQIRLELQPDLEQEDFPA